jgi:Glycosyl hydrolase family 63 N-terminal domain
MRHECQHSDGLLGFGYEAHNGKNYARQVIPDLHSNVQLTTEWVANPLAGQNGSWDLNFHLTRTKLKF